MSGVRNEFREVDINFRSLKLT